MRILLNIMTNTATKQTPARTGSNGWHVEEIKAAVRMKGTTMSALALAAGYDRTVGSYCLRQPVPAVNRAVSDLLEVPLHELWPDWFDEDGEPLPFGRKRTTAAPAPQRKNRSAA
ncbi:MAG: hypothetical protein Kow00114_22510 [Kiloniellaceae bacterium]